MENAVELLSDRKYPRADREELFSAGSCALIALYTISRSRGPAESLQAMPVPATFEFKSRRHHQQKGKTRREQRSANLHGLVVNIKKINATNNAVLSIIDDKDDQ